MFCIKCGKEAVVGNFCKECFLGKETLFHANGFRTIYCDVCGLNKEDLVRKIEATIKTNNKISEKSVSMKIVGNKVHATITCTGTIKGMKKEESKTILVVLRKMMCETHVKLAGGYYEAVMQARGKDREEILKKVMKSVPKKSIIKVVKLDEGYDIKIMRKANASAAAKILRKNFKVKQSYKLVGSKKGEKLYRNYYAIR